MRFGLNRSHISGDSAACHATCLQRASSSELNDPGQDCTLEETGRCDCAHPANRSVSSNSKEARAVLIWSNHPCTPSAHLTLFASIPTPNERNASRPSVRTGFQFWREPTLQLPPRRQLIKLSGIPNGFSCPDCPWTVALTAEMLRSGIWRTRKDRS